DYMRDLFTQALKPLGEVEDGEYDWMQINNGKGWESVVRSPNGASHINAPADQSKVTARSPAVVTSARLNAAHPPTPMQFKKRDWQSGGVNTNQPVNTGSKRVNQDIAQQNTQKPMQGAQDHHTIPHTNLEEAVREEGERNNRLQEPKKSAWQKISSTFCCG